MPSFTTRPHKHSKLNYDIISYILFLNAYMEEEEMPPALVTLRLSSQVCVSWREVALKSPQLWARVLNLNFLSQRGDGWMKEVLRRTGTILLDIKSIDYGYDKWPTAVDSVQQLLTEHWGRIRSLDLQLSSEFRPDERRWRGIFQRPAHALEFFRFSCSSGSKCFAAQNFFLFCDSAPSLRTLDAIDIPLHFPFLSSPNLRVLVLHSIVSAFTFLSALKEMPFLETLETKSDFPFLRETYAQPLNLRAITLPRLTTIKFKPVRLQLIITLLFLAHITPGDGCVLEFFGTHELEHPDQSTRDLYEIIISRYSESCAEVRTANNFEMSLLQNRFNFSVNLSPHRQFRFGIANLIQLPEGTISTLLSCFSAKRPQTIRELRLHLEYSNPILLNPDVANFVASLGSVEELKTDCRTLAFLRCIQRSMTVVLFPALQVVCLPVDRNACELEQLSRLADFIKGRVKLGVPADRLTVKIRHPVNLNIEALRKRAPGLTVQILQ